MENVNYKERLAIIEPLIMNDGLTYSEITEVTGLSKMQIHDTIVALNRPGTDIYDEKKYKAMKKKIKETASKNSQKKNILESEYEEYLKKMEYYIEKKYLVYEICKELSISNYKFNKIINSLNDPKSSNYNLTRYEKLKSQINKNANEKRAVSSSVNTIPNFVYAYSNLRLEITKRVANEEIDVSIAANLLHMPIYNYFLYIMDLNDLELKNSLRPVVQHYGVFINEGSTKDLMSYPFETQKEIALMALTYRVSYKTIANMFKVTLKNVIETFKSFNDLSSSLDYLFLETYCEDEINEMKAYNDAIHYWRKRNELIKSLNKAKKDNEVEIVEQIKRQLRELHNNIDDTLVFNLIGRKANDLTEEERDLIARYQLKYYLSSTACAEQFDYHKDTIQRFSASLAERNPIFAEKMILHDNICQEKNQAYREQYNSNFSREGGSR